ncbi:MAG: hypothetical protein A3G20_08945 [Acidobacteria bacterium RIFCSPLOWO2_12_FULL_59_11]|nr:MAG: hypothetical protein A3G20_08945 [Acidobacteria bacterium RIFCSPLOWO2_12_FULL_59_11]
MHHKFAILDGQTAITGSYRWTIESDEENFEILVILHDTEVLEAYRREVELLWEQASVGSRSGAFHCSV